MAGKFAKEIGGKIREKMAGKLKLKQNFRSGWNLLPAGTSWAGRSCRTSLGVNIIKLFFSFSITYVAGK
jgi:hypothetical protein